MIYLHDSYQILSIIQYSHLLTLTCEMCKNLNVNGPINEPIQP